MRTMKKGMDGNFLHYGIKQEDMQLIAQACMDSNIDPDWMKEYILKAYHEEKKNEELDEKKVSKILNKALKEL